MRYLESDLTAKRSVVHRSQRGFSLVELMAVVVISSILAVAGIAMFRRHIAASRSVEADSVIQAIRAGEESYLAENHVYLNVSNGTAWYPAAPSTSRHAWRMSTHPDFAAWMQLAPVVNRSVMYGYLVNAGTPGTTMPKPQVANGPDLSKPQPLDWYLIQASGDTDGNGVFSRFASTSITGEIYSENDSE